MPTKPKPETLASFALFGGLDPACCSLLADQMQVETWPAGQVIYEEGDPAHELFVVVKGHLRVRKSMGVGELGLTELGPGDFFGEMSFLDMQPRSATVQAIDEVQMWRLDYRALREAYKGNIKCYTLVVMNIAREMSRRLRRADQSRMAIQPQNVKPISALEGV